MTPETVGQTAHTIVQLAPSRFVTIDLAEALTGVTASAIRTKITRGVWIEGRQYVKRGGRVYIDLKGYERWVAGDQG